MKTFKSLIIYDSDCGFCQNSMARLRSIVGEQIDYKPRHDIADGDYGISAQKSNGAIQFVDSRAQVYSGAHAIFKALSYKAGWGIWLKLYQYLPGFKLISEVVYQVIAKYRSQISACKTDLFRNRSEQGLRVPSHRSLLVVNEDGEGRA